MIIKSNEKRGTFWRGFGDQLYRLTWSWIFYFGRFANIPAISGPSGNTNTKLPWTNSITLLLPDSTSGLIHPWTLHTVVASHICIFNKLRAVRFWTLWHLHCREEAVDESNRDTPVNTSFWLISKRKSWKSKQL